VDLTEVTHDRPVSEKLSPPFGSAYEILALVAQRKVRRSMLAMVAFFC
jgi:hypothetical protein